MTEAGVRFVDLSIKSMITDRIGQHKVLLPINHNCYIFQKQKICLGQTCAVETTSKEKIPQLWKFHNIFRMWLLLWLL